MFHDFPVIGGGKHKEKAKTRLIFHDLPACGGEVTRKSFQKEEHFIWHVLPVLICREING